MKLLFVLVAIFLLTIVLLIVPSEVRAHEPHICPDGFPETPELWGHIPQDQIVSGKLTFNEIFDAGRVLFESVFNICDGQGRPATTGSGESRLPGQPSFIRTSAPDSSSCAGCHNQPRSGGSGDFVANVFVLAQAMDPVTDSISPNISNERNTLGMFGSGPIEMLGREMTVDLHSIREVALQESVESDQLVIKSLDTKGVNFGEISAYPDGYVDTSAVKGVDPDLIIKPFHQAGVVRSIREFTDNAMNHHHGMQAEERFDLDPDKGTNFDGDAISHELTIGDITAITIFQAALGIPGRVLPADEATRDLVELGEMLFDQVGCSYCHVPEIYLESRVFFEPNPLNPPGTFNEIDQAYSFDLTKDGEKPRLEKAPNGGAIVRPYTDLKRHSLCDSPDHPDPIRFFCNEQLAQGRPDHVDIPGEEYFITRKLWDVGSSAPYGHRGDLTTITEAILAHGGEARGQRDLFVALSPMEQRAIVKFLKTLQILPGGSPRVVTDPPRGVLRSLIPGSSLLAFGIFTARLFWLYNPFGWFRS
jgi:cytochrome c peroxidase